MAEAGGANLSGAQRAAVFLLGVGEESAAGIMRHMEPREVQRVGEAMASLKGISDADLASVIREFHDRAAAVNPLGIGASDFARRVMVQALGEDKARGILSRAMPGQAESRGIEALKWMDARAVASLIEAEHPQIIAIVMASLDHDHAAAVLRQLPAALHADVMLRVARLEMVDPAAMEELDKVLEKQLGRVSKSSPRAVNGLSSAAAIMNNVDTPLETAIMDSLRAADAQLTDQIVECMFVFDDLLSLDDFSMQRLIREVSTDTLVIALKGVDEALRDKFFSNMSSRAADILREDLEVKGPVRLIEVEAVQKSILATVKQLADDGELMIGKGRDGNSFV